MWWMVEDLGDCDNVGLSRHVESPVGTIQAFLCPDCGLGPFGHVRADDPRVWLVCDKLMQQDFALANDEEDFKAPPGVDLASLEAMIASGAATVTFNTVFEEQRLGMQLGDTADGDAVELQAFTELDGGAGPAEVAAKVQLGDRVARVNGRSTQGMDYERVLELIINASRPVTIHWERPGKQHQVQGRPQERVAHRQWEPATAE